MFFDIIVVRNKKYAFLDKVLFSCPRKIIVNFGFLFKRTVELILLINFTKVCENGPVALNFAEMGTMAGIVHFQHKSLAKKLAILWWILLYSLLCNYDLQENSYEADEIAFQQTLKNTGIELDVTETGNGEWGMGNGMIPGNGK